MLAGQPIMVAAPTRDRRCAPDRRRLGSIGALIPMVSCPTASLRDVVPYTEAQPMAAYDLPSRRARYFTLSSELAHLDNTHLRALFDQAETQPGWGQSQVLHLGRAPVFVKRVPLTALEFDHLFSTHNLYDLPTYYHYGVGSAGFGVFRELVANIKTTNWVLDGAIATFPLLYHYRMLPFAEERPAVDLERHSEYVAYWNSNAHIGRYMLDRAQAPYELALFFEHLPYPVAPWLLQHPSKINRVLDDLRSTVAFLRTQGMLHFDANFDNVVSDGQHAYLTDFGLVVDKRFALSDGEALFLKQHPSYDYGEVLGSIGFLLFDVYHSLAEHDKQKILERYGTADEPQAPELVPIILENIEEIVASGIMKFDRTFVDIALKYRSVILLSFDFFVSMRRNKKKDIRFPHAKLVRLLKETDFLSGAI
jgi:hypothetical protein